MMVSHSLRHFIPVSIAIASSSLLACSDGTAPDQLLCPAAQVLLCTQAETAVYVAIVARDAESRNVSGLTNAARAAVLKQRLGALNVALAAGNITAAQRALTETRVAIEAAKAQLGQFPGDAPDLTAIELALLQVEKALQ